mmetsp:Transcript_24590/g.67872  ORF Transcript_24590/g.67872 Transcript_24590/m.67872 type:complete len:201 (-) Transcript_24590:250-852(-)
MVLSEDLPDDAGALAVRGVGIELELLHGKEDPAVDRLEAVPGVREGPSQNDGQGVLQKGGFQLGTELDVAVAVAIRIGRSQQIVGPLGNLCLGSEGFLFDGERGLVIVFLWIVEGGTQCRFGQPNGRQNASLWATTMMRGISSICISVSVSVGVSVRVQCLSRRKGIPDIDTKKDERKDHQHCGQECPGPHRRKHVVSGW